VGNLDLDKPNELDMKVFKELAKLGYTPSTLRQSFHSLQTIHDFLQFIGTHQYYSDAVNKQIFLLGLDADYTVISIEELMLKEKNFVDEVQMALVLKQKPKIDGKKLDEFKKQVGAIETDVLGLSARAKKLIEQIRAESRSKEHFFESK